MKAVSIIFLSLCSQMAFAFETGKYSGMNADQTQKCEIELVQNASTIVLKSIFCSSGGFGMSWDKVRE